MSLFAGFDGFVHFVQLGRKFLDFLADRILGRGLGQRVAVVIGLGHLRAAVRDLHLEGDVEAFGHAAGFRP